MILRQAAYTLASFALLYAAVLAITLIVAPDREQPGRLNAWAAANTIYLTSPKYVFLRRDILNVPDRKVIMVGASNTGVGLKPDQVQPGVACAKVSNIAIGSANITEVRQMIDLVLDVQDKAARQNDTFVLAVWFGMFVDTGLLWPGAERHHGDTDIDIERYRYGFYQRTSGGPVAVAPPGWLHAEVTLIKPFLLLEQLARWTTAGLRNVITVRGDDNRTEAEREARLFSASERTEALKHWSKTMGGDQTISQAQVALLHDTIDTLLQSGAKVVLVDLPLPAWHRDASPYQPGYAQMVQGRLFKEFAGRPNFAALTMPDLSADEDYSDEVHPKPSLATVWAARLAAVLGPLVCGAPGGPAGPGPRAGATASALPASGTN